MIDDAMEFATKAHEGQFRKGTRRPYIVHPIEVADIVSTMTKDEEVICAAVLHDTIEDARMSYNDVRRFLGAFNDVDFPADVDARRSFEEQVPEIVYALTNEKGRNRAERASEAYYAGIRSTRFASFVKMCDRLANIRYSTMFVFANRMLDVYREEYPDFIRAIHEGAVTPVPEAMRCEAECLLHEEAYVVL